MPIFELRWVTRKAAARAPDLPSRYKPLHRSPARNLCQRLYRAVTHMSERLKAYEVTEEGVENKFHDTVVTNLARLIDVLPKQWIWRSSSLQHGRNARADGNDIDSLWAGGGRLTTYTRLYLCKGSTPWQKRSVYLVAIGASVEAAGAELAAVSGVHRRILIAHQTRSFFFFGLRGHQW
jgi:hypothetical protein